VYRSIDSALIIRDAYFDEVGIDISTFSVLYMTEKKTIDYNLRLSSDPDNTWFHFVKGIISFDESSNKTASHFTNALSIAKNDPGATWLLYNAFRQHRNDEWAEKALRQMEFILLTNGNLSSPLLAQQLLYNSLLSKKKGDIQKAKIYATWATRLDPYQSWASLQNAKIDLFKHPGSAWLSIKESISAVWHSWNMQLAFIHYGYLWIRKAVIIFMGALLFILCWKYLPRVIHRYEHTQLKFLNYPLSTIAGIIFAFSFISFGILPFAWFLVFLLYRYAKRNEKVVLLIISFFLVCAPMDTKLRDMFIHSRLPGNSLQLFRRALHEGYSMDLYETIEKRIKSRPNDHLAHVAFALCASKGNNFSAAYASLGKAETLHPDDPSVLILAGNLYYWLNSLDKANEYFERCVSNYSKNSTARFNLAQCYLQKMKAIEGSRLIEEATKLHASRINTFISKNDTYFGEKWPYLRQVLLPDYTPGYFWMHIFPNTSGSWKTANVLWGSSLLGFPIVFSFIISILSFIALIIYGSVESSPQKTESVFPCQVCGRLICRKCKKGKICASCLDAGQFVRDNKALSTIHTHLTEHSERRNYIVTRVLDVFFPGVGGMIHGSPFLAILPFIITTSLVYATYYTLFSFSFTYPYWVTKGIRGSIFLLCISYSACFAIKSSTVLYRNMIKFGRNAGKIPHKR